MNGAAISGCTLDAHLDMAQAGPESTGESRSRSAPVHASLSMIPGEFGVVLLLSPLGNA